MNRTQEYSASSASVSSSHPSSLSLRLSDLQMLEREPTVEWLGENGIRQALHFLPHLSMDKRTRHLESFPDQAVASALGGAAIQEWLSSPQTWKNFSPSTDAFVLRKANRFGSFFNEVGEELQEQGVVPLFRGFLIPELPVSVSMAQLRLLKEKGMDVRPRHWALTPIHQVHPRTGTVLGQSVLDFSEAQTLPFPRVLPLEFIARSKKGEALPELEVSIDVPSGRKVLGMEEAMAIAAISAKDLEKAFLMTAWISGILRGFWKAREVEMKSVKLSYSMLGVGKLGLACRLGVEAFDLGLFPAESLLEALHQTKSFANAASQEVWFPQAEPLSRLVRSSQLEN